MQCPHCDKQKVERGKNCYVKVELGDRSLKKLVCNECAEMFEDHLKA